MNEIVIHVLITAAVLISIGFGVREWPSPIILISNIQQPQKTMCGQDLPPIEHSELSSVS